MYDDESTHLIQPATVDLSCQGWHNRMVMVSVRALLWCDLSLVLNQSNNPTNRSPMDDDSNRLNGPNVFRASHQEYCSPTKTHLGQHTVKFIWFNAFRIGLLCSLWHFFCGPFVLVRSGFHGGNLKIFVEMSRKGLKTKRRKGNNKADVCYLVFVSTEKKTSHIDVVMISIFIKHTRKLWCIMKAIAPVVMLHAHHSIPLDYGYFNFRFQLLIKCVWNACNR